MEKKTVHCLVLSFPAQGHINPMLQLSKLLQHEGVKVTLVTTLYYRKSLQSIPSSIAIETISDGFDNGGLEEAGGSYITYLDQFWKIGPKTLAELIEKLNKLGDTVDCVIYNSFFPWALDVAKRFGIIGVCFLTQNMSVNSIFYNVHIGKLKVPIIEQNEISLPLLPTLEIGDMPSFFLPKGQNQVLLDLMVGQFSNIDKADWILCNSLYDIEKKVVDWTMKIWPKFRSIGPSIPSMFLDKRLKDDEAYGATQFKSNEECMEWLNDKPKGSVVYVSFGSMGTLDEEQIQEIAYGLRDSESYFLWVVRAAEEIKLPKDFEKKSKNGLVVTWCSQLKVLAHEAIGCFVTHCGWNSTLESLSLGVPIVAMPQWSDQRTNAKFIVDVWKMGIRVPIDEKEIVRGDKLKNCILEIMEGEKGKEIKSNATQWKSLAVGAFGEEGISQKNIMEFVTSMSNVVNGLTN
ncbi:UDP-glycosyltransferase 74G1 [Cicer arietinum]|uniref:Glycosyltransferase n=1 Tax=Cicer arietinum TaxID=3827 RepID=A0A067XTB6_CICAR|nr:UDP-glycosyltransferase 74G1 [Cicer arietinum]AGU14133.1 UDP-glycosyltransferase [Cicer arietinum]